MIVTVDKNGGIYLKFAQPGDRFDVEVLRDGSIVLRRLKSLKGHPIKARLGKRDK